MKHPGQLALKAEAKLLKKSRRCKGWQVLHTVSSASIHYYEWKIHFEICCIINEQRLRYCFLLKHQENGFVLPPFIEYLLRAKTRGYLHRVRSLAKSSLPFTRGVADVPWQQQLTFRGCLLQATKHFICINSYNPHNSPKDNTMIFTLQSRNREVKSLA